MSLIHIQNLSKQFKILNRREGLDGPFRFTFTYVIPIGFVAFYPSQIFLRPEDVSSLVYFSPVIEIGLFAINSYTGTGS
jgi:ABC-type uncharacterized transport system permease subunit